MRRDDRSPSVRSLSFWIFRLFFFVLLSGREKELELPINGFVYNLEKQEICHGHPKVRSLPLCVRVGLPGCYPCWLMLFPNAQILQVFDDGLFSLLASGANSAASFHIHESTSSFLLLRIYKHRERESRDLPSVQDLRLCSYSYFLGWVGRGPLKTATAQNWDEPVVARYWVLVRWVS